MKTLNALPFAYRRLNCAAQIGAHALRPLWFVGTLLSVIVGAMRSEGGEWPWNGRYLDPGGARPGETIVIEFPIGQQVVKEKMGQEEFTLALRGDTVVWIDPPGRICPLFERDYYREGVRWRKVRRFVANQPIDF